MNKRDVFLAAMKAEEFRRKAWVISAFTQINEGVDAWKEDPYPYRIVQTPAGHFYVDPERGCELTKIDDAKVGAPPFSLADRIILAKGEIPNVFKQIDTNYGNVLLNFIILIYPFGHKVEFLTGRFSPRDVEKIIIKRLKDTPPEGEERDDKYLYIDEYLKFADAAFATVGYTQVCVPAATAKTMVAAPGIHALRKRLLEENADRLHDPAVIAKIDAELVAYDREWLKGDPGENFLITKKAFEIVRKKQYGMHGAETGLSESVDVTLIKNSLSEGWDINAFPAMNNSLRAGSFNRGAQTMLGGESVKWLLRASSNITVTEKDCGSKLGIEYIVDGENYDWLVGFNVIENNGVTNVPDAEIAKKYVGRTVTVRSPMYCKLNNTDFCECCVGARLAASPTALSSAVSAYGSQFLEIYMQAAHGKSLTLAKFDWKRNIF